MAREQIIGLWYDCYCDPDDHGWVVSLDEIEDGKADTTVTLSMHGDDAEAAREAANRHARERGLRIIETAEDGHDTIRNAD